MLPESFITTLLLSMKAIIHVTQHNLQYLCVVLHLTSILLKNLFDWYPMEGRTTGVDVINAVKNVLEEFNLNLENTVGVTTDGAPAMVGERNCIATLLAKYSK